MNVLITGAYGRVGTALLDHQSKGFDYTPFDTVDHPDIETIRGDVSDYEAIEDAVSERDAVVHLAATSAVDADWEPVVQNNIIGAYNCLETCRACGIESVVLASSNHVLGMYEQDHAPELYSTEYELLLDHETPVRPDSIYGTSKVFLEALGRYYVENFEYPKQVYALRIGSVRHAKYDHPYGDAEAGVANGQWERGSKQYDQQVRRMKATWQSREDAAALIECCLGDDDATFDIFYGVSQNVRRWFNIEHAHNEVGYDPADSADDWNSPPDAETSSETVAIDQM